MKCRLCGAELTRHERPEGFCDACLRGSQLTLAASMLKRPSDEPPPAPVDEPMTLGSFTALMAELAPPPSPVEPELGDPGYREHLNALHDQGQLDGHERHELRMEHTRRVRQRLDEDAGPPPPAPVEYDPATAPFPDGF